MLRLIKSISNLNGDRSFSILRNNKKILFQTTSNEFIIEDVNVDYIELLDTNYEANLALGIFEYSNFYLVSFGSGSPQFIPFNGDIKDLVDPIKDMKFNILVQKERYLSCYNSKPELSNRFFLYDTIQKDLIFITEASMIMNYVIKGDSVYLSTFKGELIKVHAKHNDNPHLVNLLWLNPEIEILVDFHNTTNQAILLMKTGELVFFDVSSKEAKLSIRFLNDWVLKNQNCKVYLVGDNVIYTYIDKLVSFNIQTNEITRKEFDKDIWVKYTWLEGENIFFSASKSADMVNKFIGIIDTNTLEIKHLNQVIDDEDKASLSIIKSNGILIGVSDNKNRLHVFQIENHGV